MTLMLGGIFNILDPVFGLELYMWAWGFLLVFAGVSYLLGKFILWNPYQPFHGLSFARKSGSNASMIFDQSLVGEMVDEKTGKCIFDYSQEEYEVEIPEVPPALMGVVSAIYTKIFYYPTKYLKNITPIQAIVYKFGNVNKDVEIARHLQRGEWERSPTVSCSGVDVDIIIDTDNWTIRDSPQHRAIENAARAWNELNPGDRVESYAKFQRKLMSGEIVCPEVRKMAFVSWTRIDAGFPMDLQEVDWAGKRRQMAEEQFDADAMSKNKMALILLGGSLGLAGLVLVIRLITHFI
jgi:hypothetical protein